MIQRIVTEKDLKFKCDISTPIIGKLTVAEICFLQRFNYSGYIVTENKR